MNITQKMTQLGSYSVAKGSAPDAAQFDAAIGEVEFLAGSRLSKSYIDFVRRFGVFAVDTALVPNTDFSVSVFLGVTTAPQTNAYDLRWSLSTLKGRIPANALPIAIGDGGDYFLLNLETFQVDFWAHETEEVTPISINLESFLMSLEPIGEED